MAKGMEQQKLAADAGHWLLYRYNPALAAEGKNPLQLDSKPPKVPLQEFFSSENRYRVLQQNNPAVAAHLLRQAQEIVNERWQHYAWMAKEE
jgi:pyruvate-ferredoxin/flavodoxin oxidoreductase